MTDLVEFKHLPLEEEFEAIGGRYRFLKEEVLEFGGRSVLYLVGAAIFDTTCCGVGGCGYVLVPGYLVKKHVREDDSGTPVSLVEPIKSDSLRKELREVLLSRESVNQVNFL